MYAMTFTNPDVSQLAEVQHGVSTRQQLMGLGLTLSTIDAQLGAQRWKTWGSHVLIMHNFEPTRTQLMWAAVLDARYPVALASHTSLELHGFKPFAREASQVHLIIERGAKVTRHPMITVHESRRVKPEYHVEIAGLPCTDIARSAIDAAALATLAAFCMRAGRSSSPAAVVHRRGARARNAVRRPRTAQGSSTRSDPRHSRRVTGSERNRLDTPVQSISACRNLTDR
jgi:hypothetical protein